MRRRVLTLAGALSLFVVSGVGLHLGFYAHSEISDLPEYRVIGGAISAGAFPYDDVPVEYPPAALPAFVLPEVLPRGGDSRGDAGYRSVFERLMWLCGGVVLVGMAVTLRHLGASARREVAALVFAALAPLLLGTVYLLRFDLWPAAVVALAAAALVAGWSRSGALLLGVGTAIKVYPVVLLPLALVYVWRRRGTGLALQSMAAFLGAVFLLVLPFLALAPQGVWASLERQHGRPLQMESLGGALVLVLHHVGDLDVVISKAAGSDNVEALGSGVTASLHDALQLAALVLVWVVFARGAATSERLVRCMAAAVTAYVAFGKVLSPQYLIWLVSLVPLVGGRRGILASALLAATLVLTQVWFPFRYYELRDLEDSFAAFAVLGRDLLLLALLSALLLPLSRADRPSAPTAR